MWQFGFNFADNANKPHVCASVQSFYFQLVIRHYHLKFPWKQISANRLYLKKTKSSYASTLGAVARTLCQSLIRFSFFYLPLAVYPFGCFSAYTSHCFPYWRLPTSGKKHQFNVLCVLLISFTVLWFPCRNKLFYIPFFVLRISWSFLVNCVCFKLRCGNSQTEVGLFPFV